MGIAVACPACGKNGKIPDSFQGSQIRCPACKARFEVGIETKLVTSKESAGRTTREPEGSENREPRSVKTTRSRKKLWLLVPGLIACLFLYDAIHDWLYPNYISLGFHARKRGDLVDAERYYRRAVDQGGNGEHMAVSLAGLGRTYFDLHRFPEAEKAFGTSAEYHRERARNDGPTSAWAMMASELLEDLGRSQFEQKKWKEGIENFVSGLEMEQNIYGYKTGVDKPLQAARVLRSLKQYPSALKWIEQAENNAMALYSNHDPKFHEIWPECLKELVAIYRESGMVEDEAIEAKVLGIERNIRQYEENKRVENSPKP